MSVSIVPIPTEYGPVHVTPSGDVIVVPALLEAQNIASSGLQHIAHHGIPVGIPEDDTVQFNPSVLVIAVWELPTAQNFKSSGAHAIRLQSDVARPVDVVVHTDPLVLTAEYPVAPLPVNKQNVAISGAQVIVCPHHH
jgi:hypothetical protein